MSVSIRSPAVARLVRLIGPPILISAGATIWCWWATGAGLGLFLAAPMLLSFYAPALAVAGIDDHGANSRSLAQARPLWTVPAMTLGTAIVWRIAMPWSDLGLFEWLGCDAVLFAWAVALAGISCVGRAAGLSDPSAAGISALLALLWLTWPVWLSHWMTQGIADWLSPAHPLFAINSVIEHLGSWDRAPIAYRSLTVLNQDVSYRLPSSIAPSVLLHLAIGLVAAGSPLRSAIKSAASTFSANG